MAVSLVHLPEIERLSRTCIRILGGNPGKFSLQGTNTYLLGTGPERILIDTGEGKLSWITALKKVLAEEKAIVHTAVITHWHHDHQGGIKQLLDISPATKIYKNSPEGGQLNITDGQIFEVEGARLIAMHTPGHTDDHMTLLLPEEDAMFTGDNVLGQGTAVFENLGTYINSLEKMRLRFKGRGYPGHGPVLQDGPAKITEYIRHRKQREDQVVQTLRNKKPGASESETDAWTVMELVKVIYVDVPEELHIPAAGGVVQILGKLEREGRVCKGEEGGRWQLTGRPTL